jgi:hypothetical protein
MANKKVTTLREGEEYRKLVVRLSPDLDALLHTFTHRRGDVKDIFMAMFGAVVWKSVPLLERAVDQYGEGVFRKSTSIEKVPTKLYEKIEAMAKCRDCSLNDLVSSGLAWYLQQRKNAD